MAKSANRGLFRCRRAELGDPVRDRDDLCDGEDVGVTEFAFPLRFLMCGPPITSCARQLKGSAAIQTSSI